MATTPNPATTTTAVTAATTVTRPNTKPTTTTTSTTTPPRPQSPFQQIHHHPIYPVPVIRTQTQNPTNHQGILYPVASSGRGFIPRPAVRPQQDHPTTNTTTTTITHQRAYQPRGVGVAYRPNSIGSGSPSSRSHPLPHHPHPHPHPPPHPHPAPAQLDHQHHVMSSRQHPTHLQHPNYIGGVSSGPVLGSSSGSGPPIKGIPVAGQHKIAASPSQVSDSNGYKRDRSRDDNLVVVRDRKVRITDGASLYVLCRSWLRNGFPEESQHHYGDSIKPLPRPLLPKKEDNEEVETEKEDEESVDDLSTQDILKRHIKHAKKVRARLREERLKRIARYKGRLALLLPPQVEQSRNDAAAGN